MARKECKGRPTVDGRLVEELYENGLPPGIEVGERSFGWVIRKSVLREDGERGDRSEWRVFSVLTAAGRANWLDVKKVVWVGKDTLDDSLGIDVKVGKCSLGFYRDFGIDQFVVQVKSSLTGAEEYLDWAERQSVDRMSRTERRAGTKNGLNGKLRDKPDQFEKMRARYAVGYRYLAKERSALVVAGDWPNDNIYGQIVFQMIGMSGMSEETFLRAFYGYDPEMVEAYLRSRNVLVDLLWGLSCEVLWEGCNGNGNGGSGVH